MESVPLVLKPEFLNVTTMSSTFTNGFPLIPLQDDGPLIVAIIVKSSFD